MYCDSIDESFKQISAYFKGESTGYPLILDTENIGIYSEIIQRLEADKTKECNYVSDSCQKMDYLMWKPVFLVYQVEGITYLLEVHKQ